MRPFIHTCPFGRPFFVRPVFVSRLGSFPASFHGRFGFGFREFTSRPILSPMDPATRYIHEFNKNGGFEKWGWIFYRCTYNNDEGWNRFKQMITQEMHKDIANSDTPEINRLLEDNLKMTFIEDQNEFDGASKDQLRAHFQGWIADAFSAENPRATRKFDPDMVPPPRYRYFIQIDEDALRSVLYDPEKPQGLPGQERWGYVNFVDGWWKSLGERHAITQDPDLKQEIVDELEERYEPIEGCVEENVGWMMLDTIDVSVDFYHTICGFTQEVWPIYYQRPPGIVSW